MKTKHMTCKQPYEDNQISPTEIQQHVSKSQPLEKDSPYAEHTKPVNKPSPYGAKRIVSQKNNPYASNQVNIVEIDAYSKKTSPYSMMCLTTGVFLKIDDTHFLIIGGTFNLSIS